MEFICQSFAEELPPGCRYTAGDLYMRGIARYNEWAQRREMARRELEARRQPDLFAAD